VDKKHWDEQEEYTSARFAPESVKNARNSQEESYDGFSKKSDYLMDGFQRHVENCKEMLFSSIEHFRNPVTIIVILLLMGIYILLGVTGSVGFDYYNNEAVKNINTNLDIIVNAVLGFFFGPVVCAVGVTLCGVARIIAEGESFFIGNLAGAFVAGFIHGWILYRMRVRWFGTRFRSFFVDLFVKIVTTRIVVSAFVNVLMMSVIYSLATSVPIKYFLIYYEKAGVAINTPMEFIEIFFIAVAFESLIVFVAIYCINLFVMKAFPSYFGSPYLIVGKNGELINKENEMEDDF